MGFSIFFVILQPLNYLFLNFARMVLAKIDVLCFAINLESWLYLFKKCPDFLHPWPGFKQMVGETDVHA